MRAQQCLLWAECCVYFEHSADRRQRSCVLSSSPLFLFKFQNREQTVYNV